MREGLWHNNPALVQLLGLCPLLAVSTSVVNGLGLGIATLFVLVLSNVSVAALRGWLQPEIRLPLLVLMIAALVTAVDFIMNAYWHELYLVLGVFIPLITTNCLIMARAEAFASRHGVFPALMDGLRMGIGLIIVLVILGGLREACGQGTLLAQAAQLFGERAQRWTIILWPDYPGFRLALLPPGAFIGLGLLIAWKNALDARITANQPLFKTILK